MRPYLLRFLSLFTLVIIGLDSWVILAAPRRWWARSYLFASAMVVNNTIDDASSQLIYFPATSWHPSDVPCSGCLSPSHDLARQQTWHEGVHIIPTFDTDDVSNTKRPPLRTQTTSSATASSTNVLGDNDSEANDSCCAEDRDDDKGGRTGPNIPHDSISASVLHDRQQNNDANPFFIPHLDSDDTGFVDQPVFAQFNFTGSAVYVYALVPLFTARANSTPTYVNLTFFLDSQRDSQYSHVGTLPAPVNDTSASHIAYQPNVMVYARSGLPEGFHSLKMDLGPDSVFLLDYIIYSQDDVLANGGNGTGNDASSTLVGTSPTSIPGGGPSASLTGATTSTKSHNIATFAGAVGGSVGLLAILSISLAFSIYRRRTLAKRRDRRLRETGEVAQNYRDSYHTDSLEDGPPMQGPAPFVPRYFPGTIPVAPPPYLPPVSPDSAEVTTPLLTSVSPVHTPLASTSWNTNRSGDASYADRPPPTPPPEADDDGYMAPPPSFGVAIASPVPAIFAQLSNVPAALASHSAAYLAQLRAQPSRRPSRTTLAEQGIPEDLPPPEQPSGFQSSPIMSRPLSIRASQSSLRQGQPVSLTPSHLADSPTASGSTPSDQESIHISNRPPSSASQMPPSIPPPSEVIEAEQEAHERRRSGLSVGEASSS